MRNKQSAVYIMSNANHSVIYTGCTPDLVRRVHEHRTHMAPESFTAQYNVEKLVYYEVAADLYEALRREKQIKGWTRRKKNVLIRRLNPEWRDLWPSLHA